MKKLFFLTISLLLAIAVQATEFTVDNLKCYVNEDGTTVAVGTTWSSSNLFTGDIVLPSTVTYENKTYLVTSVSSNAFYGCENITSVTIPSSIRSIGGGSFAYCTSLTRFIVPSDHPTFSVVEGVLFDKPIETLLFFPRGKTGDYTFPSTVKTIGYSAFRYSTLSSVTFSTSLTFMEYGSFAECQYLKKMTFLSTTPPKVINGAFENFNISNCLVYVPKSCTPMYDSVLNENNQNVKFRFLEIGAVYDYNVTLSRAGRLLNEIGAANLQNVVHLKITGPVNGTDIQLIRTMIPALSVLDMENATIVSGGNAYFTGSIHWDEVTCYTKDNEIGVYMFVGVPLDSIILPSTVTTISRYAFSPIFYYDKFLTYVKLPSALTRIEDEAFSNCLHLSDIGELPTGLSYIGKNAFYRCPLTSVTIPGSVTSISETAFQECNLQSVTILPGVKSIGKSAFEGCYNLTALSIASTVESIGEAAFRSCSKLPSPVIPSSVQSIGNYAYARCTSFTSITIPAKAKTTVGLFSGCTGVTSVAFEPGFATIAGGTFNGLTNLTSVTVPSTVTSIGESAFSGCSSLQSIVLPSGITSIGASAFKGCSRFTSFIIPSAVTSIEASTFENCSELTTINIPSGITSIGSAAFKNCSKLASFSFPSGITSIGTSTFENCSTLTSIMLPVGITSIGSYAFRNCTGLTAFHVRDEVPPVTYTDCFSGINKSACTLYVPIDCYATYFLSTGWRYFQNMEEEDLSATPQDEMSSLTLSTTKDGICVKGAEAGASITVFSANGAVVFTLIATGEEQFISLPSGVLYFVKVGEKTVKVAL